ncbi:related to phenazine biosynthesis protein phzC [Rhynchosporium secalis]|uniref:Related to phenazine biosynthesis protein phzC n=1 Tax=Rhynchosporium secalis TaxID=38038 RepID=A0A1E1MRW8_RHYSE|nr:related to phenazine biosynthesis protein phzC [Rhynchosporium secalis]
MAPGLDLHSSPAITPPTAVTTSRSYTSHTSHTKPGSIKPVIRRTPSHPLTLPFTTLDVFTSTVYTGNPLAIVRIPSPLRDSITQQQKQQIAAEFNLSETIFLHEQVDPSLPEWDVEIFTLDAELPFAGHPVIGTAAYVLGVLGAGGGKGKGRGRLGTRAGFVDIALVYDEERQEDDEEGFIEPNMSSRVSADLPHHVHTHAHTIGDLERPIPGLSLLPSIRAAELAAPLVSFVKGMTFLLVRLSSLEQLADVQLVGEDVSFHGVLDEGWRMGFVAKYYYVVLENEDGKGTMAIRSRMLEVAMEDPATGTAASALSCYLALHGAGSERMRRFEVTQGVEMGRKSVIGVEVFLAQGRAEEERVVEGVRISGNAVVVMEGNLRV